MPNPYGKLIMETTGCDPEMAARIEEIMRQDIFHSTLDWQTREQLQMAAFAAKEAIEDGDLDPTWTCFTCLDVFSIEVTMIQFNWNGEPICQGCKMKLAKKD